MKTLNVWVLFIGLAVGVLIGRATGPAGGGGGGETARPTAAKAGAAGPIAPDWINEDAHGAKESMAGFTPAQRFAVLKFSTRRRATAAAPTAASPSARRTTPAARARPRCSSRPSR